MKKDVKKPQWLLWTTVVLFIVFLYLAYVVTGETDYVMDTFLLLGLGVLLYTAYDSFQLNSWIYLLIMGALSLHTLGMFGFYNVSPVVIQWDHVTHFVGEFAAGVFVYNFFYASGFLHSKKASPLIVLFMILCVGIGIGVFVEFIEFFGYLVVGDGLGIFGHGLGDINTEFINSEWFNTMLDLIYNFVGVFFAIIFCRYILREKYLRQ